MTESALSRPFNAGVGTMKSEAKPRVYDILAKAFTQEGVRTCFALLGDANMNWASRLSEEGCRMVYVRHEHCALASAMAYARKNWDVAVASVTCGPGVTQLITALPAAVRAHLPLVVFAGEAPLKSGWYNQEIDQAPLITSTGAAYHRLHMPERMPVAIRDAFLQARRERRPVVIGIPFDLQARPWDGPADLPRPSHKLLPHPSPIPPHPDDVASAAQLVAGAERVVVLAGLGAVEARAGGACRALAGKTGGLLSTTLPARGLFHDDPFCIGISGSFTPEAGLGYLAQADLVVAVGCSLAYHAGGDCSWFFAQMPSRPQETFLTIREFGAIGNGISFAMGVAAARPDRTVVLFDGDGSLMMHVQELETIKRHRLNILIVVMNDGAYGSELHKLRSEGMPEDGSVFGYCDFAGITRGFGLQGRTFRNLDDLPKLVAEFAASGGGAAVWDFHVSNKVVSPTIRRAHPHPGEERS